MGNQKTATINTSGGEVVVRKLVISDYAEMLRLLQDLPAVFNEIATTDKEEWSNSEKVAATVPALMAKALPELTKLLAFPTDKDADFFMQLDLADVLDLVDKILEINDYERIVAAIKKISGRAGSQGKKPAPTLMIGSTQP